MSSDFLNTLNRLVNDRIVSFDPLRYYILSHFIPFPFIFSHFLIKRNKSILSQYCFRVDVIVSGKKEIIYSPKVNLEIFTIPRRRSKVNLKKIDFVLNTWEKFKRIGKEFGPFFVYRIKNNIVIVNKKLEKGPNSVKIWREDQWEDDTIILPKKMLPFVFLKR